LVRFGVVDDELLPVLVQPTWLVLTSQPLRGKIVTYQQVRFNY